MSFCQVNWAQLVQGTKKYFFKKSFESTFTVHREGLLLLVLKVSFRSVYHYTFSSNLPQEISSSFSRPREKKEIRVSCSWHMFWRGASQSGDQMKVSEWVWVKNHPPDNCKSQKREFSPLQISTTTIDVILAKSWKGILRLGYSAPRLIPKYFSWTRQEWRGTRLECNEHDQWRQYGYWAFIRLKETNQLPLLDIYPIQNKTTTTKHRQHPHLLSSIERNLLALRFQFAIP